VNNQGDDAEKDKGTGDGVGDLPLADKIDVGPGFDDFHENGSL
jgi:hypothetical protein